MYRGPTAWYVSEVPAQPQKFDSHSYNIQLLSKFFIDSDFAIIVYMPYTCLCVCNNHNVMLCLIYVFSLLLQEHYIYLQ